MPPADSFPYVAAYGQPEVILYDGEVYSHVAIRLEFLDGLDLAAVVPLIDEEDDDMRDDPGDVYQSGPPLLVFNRGVYQKSFLDPALVSDDVLRTILGPAQKVQIPQRPQSRASSQIFHPAQVSPAPQSYQFSQILASTQPLPSMSVFPVPQAQSALPTHLPAPNTQVAPPPRISVRPTKTSMNTDYLAGFLAAQASSLPSFPIFNQAPPVPTRVMPPRAVQTDKRALQYGFDLPEAARAQMTFHEPHIHNHYFDANGRMQLLSGSRIPWEDSHKIYAWELVQFAMLSLNRELRHSEFKVITEALHRNFQGTRNAKGELYPFRGFNTVHSMVVKHPAYKAFVRAILP
ncbi:hypothetical protein DL98DRAFT_625549 [Cadophora sp. DSE1049]|nr:hypothetical protein DL98DRAFT_625549 [Cadophora sp. DSE1049]